MFDYKFYCCRIYSTQNDKDITHFRLYSHRETKHTVANKRVFEEETCIVTCPECLKEIGKIRRFDANNHKIGEDKTIMGENLLEHQERIKPTKKEIYLTLQTPLVLNHIPLRFGDNKEDKVIKRFCEPKNRIESEIARSNI